MTGDLAKGCIGIANQELCDVCKMLIRDELTRELDRYNGTKLKRMYKLMDQDMYKLTDQDMYKLAKQDMVQANGPMTGMIQMDKSSG